MGQFSYKKLWKLLIDRDMNKEDLRLAIKASPNTIAAMGKGDAISFKNLAAICEVLHCQPGDVVEYLPTLDK